MTSHSFLRATAVFVTVCVVGVLVFVLTSSSVATAAVAILGTAGTIASLFITTGNGTSSRSVSALPPTIATRTQTEERERVGLRQAHRVRAVKGLESGEKLSRLPGGIYGFTLAWDWPNPRVNATVPFGDIAKLEVNKLSDGTGCLIVYVSQETALRLRDSSQAEQSMKATVFPRRWAEAITLISLPVSAITSNAVRAFEPSPGETGYLIDLNVRVPFKGEG
jgi:hypothetical protein